MTLIVQERRFKNWAESFRAKLHRSSTGGVDELLDELFDERAASRPEAWRQFCRSFANDYPDIWALLQRDPYTRHSAAQPRGYAGDAELIDYAYFQQPAPDVCAVGRALFNCTTNAPASRAVRERRDYLARKIDAIAAQRSGTRVLSMACGHLREAQLSEALRQGAIAEIVAMDQDERSLAEVSRSCAGLPVTAMPGSVQQWIRNRFALTGFDLAYASGLYDYLNQPLGAAFTEKLFNTLRPGGQLVIPNFLPDISSVGYMECCMNWWLIYRDEQDMLKLLERIPKAQIARTTIDYESNRNIVFMLVEKA